MLVKANDNYEKYNVIDRELGRRPEVGEEFTVTKKRYKELAGDNKYNVAFVEEVEEIETAVKKVKSEKAVRKTTTKKTTKKAK